MHAVPNGRYDRAVAVPKHEILRGEDCKATTTFDDSSARVLFGLSSSREGDAAVTSARAPFTEAPSVTAAARVIYVSSSREYRIRRFDILGRPLSAVTVRAEPRPVTKEDFEDAIQVLRGGPAGRLYPDSAFRLLSSLRVPESRPFVRRVMAASDGSLAVIRADLDGTEAEKQFVDVIGTDGIIRHQFALSSAVQLVSYDGVHLFGILPRPSRDSRPAGSFVLRYRLVP
jgi:hypothetical protein